MKLDYIDGLELSDSDAAARQNELSSLAYLRQGLQFLNDQVAIIEAEVCRRVDCDRQTVALYGNAPQFYGLPLGFVAVAFHWYAVTACNYVRLIGWLGKGENPEHARAYVEAVIPTVKTWRDKVAAHFAITDPRTSDTPASLAASVMFPIGFVDRSFTASPITLAMKGGSSGAERRWSLTTVHRELSRRYWPRDEATSPS